MDPQTIQWFISLLFAIGGFMFGNLSAYKKKIQGESSELEIMRQDIKHIKENVDELIKDKRDDMNKMHDFDKRISELEYHEGGTLREISEVKERVEKLEEIMRGGEYCG